jgi:DNA repair exonuclease SbcCD ATPase subunit
MSEEQKQEYVCEICDFKTKSKKGLAGHMRLAHQKPTKLEGVSKFAEESIKKAQESMIKLLDERIQKHLEAYSDELNKVFNVLKENDQSIIDGIKKRDELLKALWKAHETLHKAMIEICKKIGVCEYSLGLKTPVLHVLHEEEKKEE